MLVDHYAILELTPSANLQEIKAAHRRLARLHHPDLNPDDLQAADRFRAIQLAYDTLTRPTLRQAYMEKRWYAQSQNQSMEKEPLTLERILQNCIELERFVSKLDAYRMDRNGLSNHIQGCLKEWTTIDWNADRDITTIEQIISLLIRSCRHLPYPDCQTIHHLMHTWLDRHQSASLLRAKWLMKKKREEQFQQWWPVWMLLLTIAIAGLIWLCS